MGSGYLLAQQLVSAGETVLDVQPKLGSRVRLLATGNVNKNDPNDARSVAIAALRSKDLRPVAAEDHAAVLKLWSKRRRYLGSLRTQVVCRLHAVLCDLVPGGHPKKEMSAGQAAQLLSGLEPRGAVALAATTWPWTSWPTCAASTPRCGKPKSASRWRSKRRAPR